MVPWTTTSTEKYEFCQIIETNFHWKTTAKDNSNFMTLAKRQLFKWQACVEISWLPSMYSSLSRPYGSMNTNKMDNHTNITLIALKIIVLKNLSSHIFFLQRNKTVAIAFDQQWLCHTLASMTMKQSLCTRNFKKCLPPMLHPQSTSKCSIWMHSPSNC